MRRRSQESTVGRVPGVSRRVRVGALLLACITASVGLVTIGSTPPAQALSGSEFNPEMIITDSLFYDAAAMSAAEIQTFLDGKIGTCLSDRCLNVAVVPFGDRAATYSSATGQLICSDLVGGNLRVSEFIYRVQVACGISSKVILATLQKEQALVTSRAPGDWALKAAMGMGCPDSSPCNDAFSGLANQIFSGTRQLKIYKAAQFGRQPGLQHVQYHPNPACGGTTLNVRNYATAALYNYTPYQPNAAALANLGGTGNDCSSYGNRNFWLFYNQWFEKSTDVIPSGVSVSRIGGSDRYEVAVGVSKSYFAPGVPVVYVASGEVFPDAISAGPAAAISGGPVLLVPNATLPASVAAELRRLAPQRITVVGGPGSISEGVFAQLAEYAPDIQRVGGMDRYEVSRNIALNAFETGSPAVYLATGEVFADALSSGAAAGSVDAPVILVDGKRDSLDEATWDALDRLGVSSVYVAGGPGSVTTKIVESLISWFGSDFVTRLGGADRFAVSAAVNRDAFANVSTFFVASGFVFPDALSATPVAVSVGAPLYVSQTGCLDRALVQHMIDAGATQMVIVGGSASVTNSAAMFKNC